MKKYTKEELIEEIQLVRHKGLVRAVQGFDMFTEVDKCLDGMIDNAKMHGTTVFGTWGSAYDVEEAYELSLNDEDHEMLDDIICSAHELDFEPEDE